MTIEWLGGWRLSLLGSDHRSEPSFGLLASLQRLRKCILSIPSGQTLSRQFRFRRFLSLRSRLRLGHLSSDCFQSFILGQTLVCQLGLKIADRNLRLCQRSLSAFSHCCFGSDGLPSGVKLVGAAFAIWLVIPANDGDRRLAAASEPTSLLGGGSLAAIVE